MKGIKGKHLHLSRKTASSNDFCSKLRSQAGETIGETLIALLISALALTMLAGAISTAANLITKSEIVMTNYYGGLTALGDPNKGDLTVSVSESSDHSKVVRLVGGSETVSAKYAINNAISNKHVLAYKKISG